MRQNGSVLARVVGRALFAALLLLALAYPAARFGLFEWPRAYDPLALPDLSAPPGLLTDWQMKLVDSDPKGCALVLQRAGLTASLKPPRGNGNCVIETAVSLSRLSRARVRPEDARCAIAARLYMWERHILQPAAQRLFGQQVTEILHFGSYSCRTMRGGNSMSEHATANAFDISGFVLANGQRVSVKADWGKSNASGKISGHRPRWSVRLVQRHPLTRLQRRSRRPLPCRHGLVPDLPVTQSTTTFAPMRTLP